MFTLEGRSILSNWSTLIEGCQGRTQELFEQAETNLDATKAPGVVWKQESVAMTGWQGLRGKRHDYLIIQSKLNPCSNYIFLLGARDYGNHLDVSWFLTKTGDWSPEDIFGYNELEAYLTVTYHAIERAITELAEESTRLPFHGPAFFGLT